MLNFKKTLILSLLATLPMQVTATSNPAMVPIISYLLSDSSTTPQVNGVANAGTDQTIDINSLVTLNGSASTNTTSYSWSFTQKPQGSTAILSNASTQHPTFTADQDGIYKIELSVNGGDSDTVQITSVANIAPIANAGTDKTVEQGKSITITGNGTDSDGTVVAYTWKQGSTTLATTRIFTHSFTNTGTKTLTLTVRDNDGATHSDNMLVTVTTPTPPPPAGNIILTKTGQTTSYRSGDDGAYKKGVSNSFTRNNSTDIVTDSGTGLMWEDKIWQNNTDGAWNYWVEPDNCDFSDGGICTDTSGDTVVSHCEALNLGSHNDWRVPTKDEILTIMDYSGTTDFHLSSVFKARPRAHGADDYFIAESVAEDEEHVHYHWYASFESGEISTNKKANKKTQTRCVRSDVVMPTQPHIQDGNRVTTDLDTGLMWEDTDWDLKSSDKRTSWNVAVDKCNSLNLDGHSDWRLPNVKEMMSLVDLKNHGESPIKKGVGTRPFCRGGNWTSTTIADSTDKAYFVQMGYGFISINLTKGGSAAFGRCVREAN